MLLVFFLPFATISAVFGIDFGSQFIKVGMVQPGRGVHVALNQQSKRLSPSYFAFWNISSPKTRITKEHWTLEDISDCNWAFLDAAKSHSMRFPNNMIKGISPILGNINGLTRREVMALLLRHLITTVDEGRWNPRVSQLVLAVEPFLPRADRMAMAEAVRLSNATISAIIDSPTAAAQVYALEKRLLYASQPKNVMFIDYGATYTWATIHRFEDNNDSPVVQELSIVTNTSLGGDLMDKQLAQLLMKQFSLQNKLEMPTDKRVVLRFIEEAKRAKEILSLNKDVDINLEDLVDEYGLHYHLTRDEFESLISDCNQSLRNLFNEALAKAGINETQLDSIELIGGVTRVPYVQTVLKEISGMEKLNRTMNSDEVVALGAGYRGASFSAAFIVKKVAMTSFSNANISIIHNGNVIQLFNLTSKLNETAEYVFNATENAEITIAAETNLSTFVVPLPENLTEAVLVNLTFGFDNLTLPNVTSVYVNETSVPISQLNFTFPNWTLSPEQFEDSTNFICTMDQILDERARFAKIKNDYEGYIYRVKDNLNYNATYKKVVNETERENLTAIASEHEQWLFDTHPVPLNESMIRDKLDEFHRQTHAAENRAEEYIKRAPAFNKLNISLNNVFTHLNKTWAETKPWLTEEQLSSVWSQYNRTREWFDEKYAAQLNTSDYEDPVVTVNQIDTQRMLLEWNFNSTNKIKKPTPTPVPKPQPAKYGMSLNGTIINGVYLPFDAPENVNGTELNGTIINATYLPFTEEELNYLIDELNQTVVYPPKDDDHSENINVTVINETELNGTVTNEADLNVTAPQVDLNVTESNETAINQTDVNESDVLVLGVLLNGIYINQTFFPFDSVNLTTSFALNGTFMNGTYISFELTNPETNSTNTEKEKEEEKEEKDKEKKEKKEKKDKKDKKDKNDKKDKKDKKHKADKSKKKKDKKEDKEDKEDVSENSSDSNDKPVTNNEQNDNKDTNTKDEKESNNKEETSQKQEKTEEL